MWEITDSDFKKISAWGLDANPFKAINDYSDLKSELRWSNKEQMSVYKEYVKKREEYIKTKDFDDYYRTAEKPIDRLRWEYLMRRKAWFIMPLGWDYISSDASTVADFGCGDGDTVQRLITFIDQIWIKKGIKDKKLHITGFDLNASRIKNAQKHVTSPNPNITFSFEQGDLVNNKLNAYKDFCFDYALCSGVLEILNDFQFTEFMNEMCRLISKGIYIEDLYERFPGGFPRDTLGLELYNRGFSTKARHVIFSEPFNLEKLEDPKKLWPMLLDQNLFAIRNN